MTTRRNHPRNLTASALTSTPCEDGLMSSGRTSTAAEAGVPPMSTEAATRALQAPARSSEGGAIVLLPPLWLMTGTTTSHLLPPMSWICFSSTIGFLVSRQPSGLSILSLVQQCPDRRPLCWGHRCDDLINFHAVTLPFRQDTRDVRLLVRVAVTANCTVFNCPRWCCWGRRHLLLRRGCRRKSRRRRRHIRRRRRCARRCCCCFCCDTTACSDCCCWCFCSCRRCRCAIA